MLTPWTKAYSHALQMQYAYRQTTEGPEVMTEDKTRYSPREVLILSTPLPDGTPGEITPEVHLVKRVFGGVVVK